MSILHPNEQEFERVLQENAVVMVDFWATWCGPCKMVAPVLEKVAAKYAGRAAVVKVDIDKQQALAERFQIMSIPTVIVFENGKPVRQEVGARAQDVYERMLDASL